MLQPKKTKFRRCQKGRIKGFAHRGQELAFGSQGQVWIRVFPDKPITKKPLDVRMGKGKGAPEGFVVPLEPGRIIFEVEGVSYDVAKEALRLAAQKLPVTTKFVVRRDYDATQNA